MRLLALGALLAVFSVGVFAQGFEGSISGGVSRLDGKLGSLDTGNSFPVTLDSGFRLAFRLTVNAYRYAGYEFGYAYNRTHLDIASTGGQGMAIHQGFGNFLLYATPRDTKVRPFVTGGLHFSNFVPPGASAQYGQGENKFGFNYGGGVKFLVSGPWQVRFDVRQYNTGKPFDLYNASGRLLQTEVSFGIGYTM